VLGLGEVRKGPERHGEDGRGRKGVLLRGEDWFGTVRYGVVCIGWNDSI
jgi:hypothetical protein